MKIHLNEEGLKMFIKDLLSAPPKFGVHLPSGNVEFNLDADKDAVQKDIFQWLKNREERWPKNKGGWI